MPWDIWRQLGWFKMRRSRSFWCVKAELTFLEFAALEMTIPESTFVEMHKNQNIEKPIIAEERFIMTINHIITLPVVDQGNSCLHLVKKKLSYKGMFDSDSLFKPGFVSLRQFEFSQFTQRPLILLYINQWLAHLGFDGILIYILQQYASYIFFYVNPVWSMLLLCGSFWIMEQFTISCKEF